MTSIKEYRSYRELFNNLALRELRSKYRRSVLGWAWSMINPLTSVLVYTVVFGYFLHVNIQRPMGGGHSVYALYLMCAMLPWNFFQNCVTGSIAALIGNANLIKKTYFPRELLPAATAGANLVMHLIEMSILSVVLVAFGNWRIIEYLPITFVFILLMAVYALGTGLLLSSLNVFYRDIEHFTNILFLLWLYLTPLLYPETYLSKHVIHGVSLLAVAKLNPMTDFAEVFRDTLYFEKLPSVGDMVYITIAVFITLAVGMKVFGRLQTRMAEEL